MRSQMNRLLYAFNLFTLIQSFYFKCKRSFLQDLTASIGLKKCIYILAYKGFLVTEDLLFYQPLLDVYEIVYAILGEFNETIQCNFRKR